MLVLESYGYRVRVAVKVGLELQTSPRYETPGYEKVRYEMFGSLCFEVMMVIGDT